MKHTNKKTKVADLKSPKKAVRTAQIIAFPSKPKAPTSNGDFTPPAAA